jgi:4-hydroxy-3-polyprenylbenzoate decarboxylase
MKELNLIVAVSGASGALFGAEFLRALAAVPGRSSLIVSPAGLRVYNQEIGRSLKTPEEYLSDAIAAVPARHEFILEDHTNIGARPASGSAPYHGMVILPCSMKTLAGIAHGYTANLIERAADVTLKERRRLIVCPRETPYSLIHLRNMTALTEAGGIVLPVSPGYYQKPQTLDDLGRFIAGRILSLFGIDHSLFAAWQGQPVQNS